MQIIHKIDPHLSIAISFKFFLVDRIDPPENESTILSISKNLDSLINNKGGDFDLRNRLVSISRSARVVEPGPKLGEAELPEFSMNCWGGRPSGNERYSSIRWRKKETVVVDIGDDRIHRIPLNNDSARV